MVFYIEQLFCNRDITYNNEEKKFSSEHNASFLLAFPSGICPRVSTHSIGERANLCFAFLS